MPVLLCCCPRAVVSLLITCFIQSWDYLCGAKDPYCVRISRTYSYIKGKPSQVKFDVFRHACVSCTYPCKSVRKSHFRISTDISNGRSNKKKLKNKSTSFWSLLLGRLFPPSQLVPNPFNWSPNTFFLQISWYWSFKSKKLIKQGKFF